MNVYDFDNTIYKGDSTLDFYYFCIKKKPGVIKYLPVQIWGYILYKMKRIDKTAFKSKFFIFLKNIENIEELVKIFWDHKQNKIKTWYIEKKLDDDLIISASPQFLLAEICNRLDIKNLIASDVDPKTGVFNLPNCYGKEKVRRFKEKFSEVTIDNFYSDSYSDQYLAELSVHSYFIDGNKIINWK